MNKDNIEASKVVFNLKDYSFNDSRRLSQILEFYKNKLYDNSFIMAYPLIFRGLEQLREGLFKIQSKQLCFPLNIDNIELILLGNLLPRISKILFKTFALEINIARLQGDLIGGTPQERYISFQNILNDKNIISRLFSEYPTLFQNVIQCIDQFNLYSLEFVEHLCDDWELIKEKFNSNLSLGDLSNLNMSSGDIHNGGQSVVIATFDSGFKIVYKPRSLAIDLHFQELLTWVNSNGFSPKFRTLKILDNGNYGWVEFISHDSCSSSSDVEDFYFLQGGYLAVLYALDATDLHFENLIAAGRHPILVDLETLFHPRLSKTESDPALVIVNQLLNDSVLGIGLLPQRIWFGEESSSIDLSGLGTVGTQLTPDRLPYIENIGTDQMCLKRRQMEMTESRHRPSLLHQDINTLEYQKYIVNGFSEIYRLLLQNKEYLLSAGSPIFKFVHDEIRVVLRPTRIYSLLLQESYHPDVLKDCRDRDRIFDALDDKVKLFPYLEAVVSYEKEDLSKGYIPKFTTYPNSVDLWSSSGQRLKNFFTRSSLDAVQHRLTQLSETDMKQQIWLIRTSLATLASHEIENELVLGSEENKISSQPQQRVISCDRFLKAAISVGDDLDALAVLGQYTTWLGLTLIEERHWCLLPAGLDLYSGLPGIILFLAYLGSITSDNRYTDLAHSALHTLRHQVQKAKGHVSFIGGFNGWGGVIYTFSHLGKLWQKKDLLSEAEEITDFLCPLIKQDQQFDIIGGAAGCILSLISLYHCYPSERILNLAEQCGEHIIANAKTMRQGVGWICNSMGPTPLTGFSHGAAGIAWVLLELEELTGNSKFRKIALNAIEYERDLFQTNVKNWPDLRQFSKTLLQEDSERPSFMNAWCHGAPGIGLARLRCLAYVDDVKIRSEITHSLNTTLTNGFGYNHSLCHGDLGNLEIFLQASQIINAPHWKTQADGIAGNILNNVDRQGWLCGVPLKVDTPGLMTGLAGIGYQLLRLIDPERVPSILVLEPPKFDP